MARPRKYNSNERRCYRCLATKPIDNFVKDKRKPDGVGYFCKECQADKSARYRGTTLDENYLPVSIRFAVLMRDKFTCQYCGASAPDVRLEVDHIFPESKGGQYTLDNLRTACRECNLGKRDIVL